MGAIIIENGKTKHQKTQVGHYLVRIGGESPFHTLMSESSSRDMRICHSKPWTSTMLTRS